MALLKEFFGESTFLDWCLCFEVKSWIVARLEGVESLTSSQKFGSRFVNCSLCCVKLMTLTMAFLEGATFVVCSNHAPDKSSYNHSPTKIAPTLSKGIVFITFLQYTLLLAGLDQHN